MLHLSGGRPWSGGGQEGAGAATAFLDKTPGLECLGPEAVLVWLVSQERVREDAVLSRLVGQCLTQLRGGRMPPGESELWAGRVVVWWPCRAFSRWPPALAGLSLGKLKLLRGLVGRTFRIVAPPEVVLQYRQRV